MAKGIRWNRKLESVYVLALALSLFIIGWQRLGMNLVFDLPIGPNSAVSVTGDRIYDGRSIYQLEAQEQQLMLQCQLFSGDVFPFCALELLLTGSAQDGVDLSRFSTLIVDLEYQASARDTLMFYLYNHEVVDSVAVERANLAVRVPSAGRARYQIELDELHVPSWWVFAQTKAVSGQVKLNNVTKLQIASGDSPQSRNLNISLSRVRLEGKWLSAHDLNDYLLVGWLMLAVMHLLYNLSRLRHRAVAARQQALELQKINRFLEVERSKLEQQVRLDPLTGCLNRLGLSQILQQMLTRQTLEPSPVESALIVFDMDHFKQINDAGGHTQGDEVLKKVAALARLHLRETDHLIRWGGEEFLIVCENISLAGAISFAENLRQRIAQSASADGREVTASFGVARFTPADFEAAFQHADRLLYQAKAEGRNCVRPALVR